MKQRLKFNGKQFRQGSYSSVMIVIVIAIVIVINLAASQIPSQYAQLDVTDNQLYSIGDQTRSMLSELTEDVEIYYICQEGSEDDVISKMLDRYADGSSHIKVTKVDPVVNPQFAAQYTDETVYDNSLVVVCGDTYQYIPYSDMYVYEMNYSTYTSQQTAYDGEGRLTSAISYVTSDDLPKMYILQGHNEAEISSTLEDRISKQNITTETLSLLTLEAVPEDCDILMINSPQTDLSETEAQYIIDYLDNGGKVFMTSTYTDTEMPNFDSILSHYGLAKTDGIVVEGNSNYYYPGYPSYLLPDFESHTITTDFTSNHRYVILPSAQGISVGDAPRDGVTVNSLLTTSDDAYSKVNVTSATTYDKEDGDIDGPFPLAVAVSETIESEDTTDETTADETTSDSTETTSDTEASQETEAAQEEDKEAQLVYVSTSGLLDDTMNSVVSGGNYDFFMNAISWMSGETSSVSIDEKSLSYEALMVTAGSANMWGIVLIAAVPVTVLVIGVIVWVQRRRR